MCLSSENYTWDTEINTVSISDNLENDRLIILVNARSGVEIFSNLSWKKLDKIPALDLNFRFGYFFLVNFNASVVAKAVDLQSGKSYSVYHDDSVKITDDAVFLQEIPTKNSEIEFSNVYFMKEISLDKIVIVSETESKTGSVLDRKQCLKLVKIGKNCERTHDSIEFLDAIPGQARVLEISSNKTHICAITSFGVSYLFNLFSLKLEKVFVEQTRYCGDQISLHPYVGAESGQIFSVSLSNSKGTNLSNQLLLVSDGYNLSVIQHHCIEAPFLRFWKTCKFYRVVLQQIANLYHQSSRKRRQMA